MKKTHFVNVAIVNNTNFALNLKSDYFKDGQLDDGNSWPPTIAPGETPAVVVCRAKEGLDAEGCSGWVRYTVDAVDVYFAFSNPGVGQNGIDIGADENVWNEMRPHYDFPINRVFQLKGATWLSCYVESTSGLTNHAQYRFGLVDLSVITPANFTLENVRAVFKNIPTASSYRKYFKCDANPTGSMAFAFSHFKGISVHAGKYIFSHTNIAPPGLPEEKNGKIIIGDDLPEPGQAQIEGAFDTLHPGWPHPCSSQACGSFMALGIQQAASSPGSDVSEIEILDIRPTAVNQPPVLLGVIARPTIGVNGVGMTKEIGPDGKYIVAAVNGDNLTFYKSVSANLIGEGQAPSFEPVLQVTGFAE
jgi:hypothetical protein